MTTQIVIHADSPAVRAMAETLLAHLPMLPTPHLETIEFVEVASQTMRFRTEQIAYRHWIIEYSHLVAAARGFLHAAANRECEQTHNFESLGIMLDCSRNRVPTVENFKKWLRVLALLGYNQAMLYTEDTYRLPGEPYFGYLRGAYSLEEIRELDDYAASLGIEMVACIQTLGHLAQILKWVGGGAYSDIKDTHEVLRTDTARTYELISKMLDFWSSALRSRKIHIGMDETHDLGRGARLDHCGWHDPRKIFADHLCKVRTLCTERSLAPMIWSDMYFRMTNAAQDYYSDDPISEEVKNAIPSDVSLVYWDYYHDSENFYSKFIARHREMGCEPIVASGIWTWGRLWYDHHKTTQTALPCIEACRKDNVKNLFFTMWGDDGAYCDWASAFAGLTLCAERAWGGHDEAKIFETLFQTSYETHIEASNIHCLLQVGNDHHEVNPLMLLWDDPLYAAVLRNWLLITPRFIEQMIAYYNNLIATIEPYVGEGLAGDYAYPLATMRYLIAKLTFRKSLEAAYQAGDKLVAARLATETLPALENIFSEYCEVQRRVWLRDAKPFGLEVLQIRNAAQSTRLQECARRIQEWTTGIVSSLPEFEESIPAEAAPIYFGSYWCNPAKGSCT